MKLGRVMGPAESRCLEQCTLKCSMHMVTRCTCKPQEQDGSTNCEHTVRVFHGQEGKKTAYFPGYLAQRGRLTISYQLRASTSGAVMRTRGCAQDMCSSRAPTLRQAIGG